MAPTTTAPVVAQVSRSPQQAQLRRFLRGCDVADFSSEHAHEVGWLLARAEMSDVVDAHVVVVATPGPAIVLTSDPDSLRRLSSLLQAPIRVLRI